MFLLLVGFVALSMAFEAGARAFLRVAQRRLERAQADLQARKQDAAVSFISAEWFLARHRGRPHSERPHA